MLAAQVPGVVGLGLVAWGLLMVTTQRPIHTRAVASIFGVGIAFIGYWALANRSDDYNF
jgi:hypothetical protein